MKQLFILIILSITLGTSCSIQQDYTINEDNSGDLKFKLDFSQMMAILPDSAKDEAMGDLMSKEALDSINDLMENYEGIHNFQYASTPSTVEISLDFDDLNALHKMEEEQKDGEQNGELIAFKPLGKNGFQIDLSPLQDLSKSLDEEGGEDAATASMMMSFIQMKITVNFERPIKSVKSSLGNYDATENKIVYDFSMAEVIKENTDWLTEVKFK